jgi:S-formylglutathione hydrolase
MPARRRASTAVAALALAAGLAAAYERPPRERPIERLNRRLAPVEAGEGLSYHVLTARGRHLPIEYSLYVPPAAVAQGAALPILVVLPDEGSNARLLAPLSLGLGDQMRAGDLPPMVVVVPSAARGLYLDRPGGGGEGESFLASELLPEVRRATKCAADPRQTLLVGTSIGGAGALRMAFRHPEDFGAVAAVAPAISPGYSLSEASPEIVERIRLHHPALESVFGGDPKAADEAWKRANPAWIAHENAAAIRAAKLQIFLTVGTADDLGCYPGTKFLHQVLSEQKVAHIYEETPDARHDREFKQPALERAIQTLAATLPAE